MNKKELVEKVMKETGITKKKAEEVLQAYIKAIEEALKNGEKVTFVGFGSFGTRTRAKRSGVNPKTGEKIVIPAKTVPFFKPGKALKKIVSGK